MSTVLIKYVNASLQSNSSIYLMGGFKSPFWPVEQYFTRILIWILNATSLCKTNTVCLLLCWPKNIFIFDFMFTLWSLKPCSKTNCAYIHMYANFFLAYHRSFTNLQGRLIIYFQWVNLKIFKKKILEIENKKTIC